MGKNWGACFWRLCCPCSFHVGDVGRDGRVPGSMPPPPTEWASQVLACP